MRKQYKVKLRSCKLCKPHKMGRAHRFKTKVRDFMNRTDKEILDAEKITK